MDTNSTFSFVRFFELPLTCLFYGIYLVLFAVSVHLFRQSKRRTEAPARINNVARSGLFVAITGELILLIIQFSPVDLTTNDAAVALGAESPISIGSFVLFVVELALSDLLMIYRLRIIWGRSVMVIIPPTLSFIAALACGGLYIYDMAVRLPPNGNLFSPPYLDWLAAGLACSLGTNGYCTACVSYKVWRVQRDTEDFMFVGPFSRSSSTILVIFIESVALYTATSLGLLIAYALQSTISFVIADVVSLRKLDVSKNWLIADL
ncbi:hypothetical protein PHLGIDRAFT_212415 [Phlebiopsis gigantea 11061_1 CR5-6]|uniref:Uncharacterized protein n=1 Tax=Phlebiopsis gigantea (strain 11061_1 CR5-6) TaxID=745531 RepID=A0A0C3S6E1_PHLG1|nr:hypothetical protein PHLGIDRAFT_212415 [Phlebiopsis gigantea 11061_1 CR5-6]